MKHTFSKCLCLSVDSPRFWRGCVSRLLRAVLWPRTLQVAFTACPSKLISVSILVLQDSWWFLRMLILMIHMRYTYSFFSRLARVLQWFNKVLKICDRGSSVIQCVLDIKNKEWKAQIYGTSHLIYVDWKTWVWLLWLENSWLQRTCM